MGIAEIKEAAGQLSEQERRELSAFLILLGRKNDPEWQTEMARRVEEIENGEGISQAALEEQLKSKDT